MVSKIEELKRIAIERGGKCLSNHYVNATTKLKWECAKGHQWEAHRNSVGTNRTWCPECYKARRGEKLRKFNLNEFEEHAEKLGGKCLSAANYKNIKTKLLWQCAMGHQWEASWAGVHGSNSWCPKCAITKNAEKLRITNIGGGEKLRKFNLSRFEEHAEKKGGKCLSASHYKNAYTKLLWQCAMGHQWEAHWNSIIHGGTWCPKCSLNHGERICRLFFEQLFKTPFIKIKPKWLLSERGFKLELDGYSEKMALAFEHQGTQHYIERNHFKDHLFYGQGNSKFKIIQARDKLKLEQCNKQGILIIQIPSILETLGVDNVKQFIKKTLQENHYPLPNGFDATIVNLEDAYNNDLIKICQDKAKEMGGKLISSLYEHSKAPLLWECAAGHQWEAPWNRIDSRGSWCPKCANSNTRKRKLKGDLEEFRKHAISKGGLCLSNSFGGYTTNYHWQCDKGHHWKDTWSNVGIRGTWCPVCKKKERLTSIEKAVSEINEFAAKKGGKCLTVNKYKNVGTKLLWQCDKRHQWEATVTSVVESGTWCSICSGHKKKSIAEIQQYAKGKGGLCLSGTYKNNKTKLLWQCSIGHQWEQQWDRMGPRGRWCPECYNIKKAKPTRAQSQGHVS